MSIKECNFIKFYLCLRVLMSTALLNLDSFADVLQEFSKSSQKYWQKNLCYIPLRRWLFRKLIILLTVMIKTTLSKLKMSLCIVSTEESFCKLSRPCKNSCCFQKMVQLFNLMRIILLA